MRNKIIQLMALGFITIVPQTMMAQSNSGGYGSDDPGKGRKSPAQNSHVLIMYNETSTLLGLQFLSNVTNVEIEIKRNGVVITNDMLSVVAGQTVAYILSAYGTGSYVVYVRENGNVIACEEMAVE